MYSVQLYQSYFGREMNVSERAFVSGQCPYRLSVTSFSCAEKTFQLNEKVVFL